MSYGYYNPNSRYQQRSQQRWFKMLKVFSFFFAVFGLGFWMGTLRVGQGHYILQKEKERTEENYIKAQDEITQLRAAAQTANIRFEQMKTSYEEILSKGATAELVDLLRQQIDSGVDPKRIENAILSARPPKNCSDPENKRFLVMTPSYKGPKSTVSIGGGAISLWGEGSPAKSKGKKIETWFDPKKQVKIFLATRGGQPNVAREGMLPLHFSQVFEDKEYRFTVSEDAQSFVKVTFDFCDYP